jgi:acyl-CoA reductase-like NAD-dependent aldehyde dehydrogenase
MESIGAKDPSDPGAICGPVISRAQRDRVEGYLQVAVAEGGTFATGGHVIDQPGFWVEPTVVAGLDNSSRLAQEEIFGPVVVAQRFEDLDEVAKAANDTCYGLGAGIWTRDISAMHRLAAKIKAGTVWGNCHTIVDPALPFGGYKQSGIGRELARQGVEAYTELKTVIISL